VRALAAEAAEGEEELNQGYHCLMKSHSRYFQQLHGQIHGSFGFYLFPCGSYSRGKGRNSIEAIDAQSSSSSQDWSMISIFMCSFGFCFLFFSWSKKLQ
jgi:hypothetical protein